MTAAPLRNVTAALLHNMTAAPLRIPIPNIRDIVMSPIARIEMSKMNFLRLSQRRIWEFRYSVMLRCVTVWSIPATGDNNIVQSSSRAEMSYCWIFRFLRKSILCCLEAYRPTAQVRTESSTTSLRSLKTPKHLRSLNTEYRENILNQEGEKTVAGKMA